MDSIFRRAGVMIGARPIGLCAAKLLASWLVAMCMSGCTALVAVVAVEAAPSVVGGVWGAAANEANPAVRIDQELAATVTARVPIYSKGDPHLVGSTQIDDGEAMSCERMPDDPPASEEEALVKLRLIAEQAGGNAVILADCDAHGKWSLTKNCYTWVRCRGTIVSIAEMQGAATGVEL
jgi:hypothetical protein